jgi:hypothetical protein
MFEIGINSIADWCSSAEEAISPHELRVLTAAQITSSLQALDFRMAAANVMHRAGEWLVSTASGNTGQDLAKQMIAASITADHYHARLVCPRGSWRRLRGITWRQYVSRRAAQTLERFDDVLLRWTVLQRIPANWIESKVVFDQISASLQCSGFRDLSIEGHLVSPFPGGADWLRTECLEERETLDKQPDGDVRAAVVFWPRSTMAVVLGIDDGEPVACASKPNDNLPVRWSGKDAAVGVLLLPPPEGPPCGPLMAFWRALGLDCWVWKAIRRWRTWRAN